MGPPPPRRLWIWHRQFIFYTKWISLCFSYAFLCLPYDFLCFCYAFPVFVYAFAMLFQCFPHAFPMRFLWISYDSPMFFYALPMLSKCFPGPGTTPTSTSKKSRRGACIWISPNGTLGIPYRKFQTQILNIIPSMRNGRRGNIVFVGLSMGLRLTVRSPAASLGRHKRL